MDLIYLSSAFIAIFSVVNPISKVVFFPLVTEGFSGQEKRTVILLAVYSSFLIFLFFGIFGKYLFLGLGVSYEALRLTGALIIATIGFDMLQGKVPRTRPSKSEREEVEAKRMVGVFPLAIPFISGPGSIITVMLYTASAPTWLEAVAVLAIVGIVLVITFIFLYYADRIAARIGKVGVLSAMRLMGMILLAIGFQMGIDSVLLLTGT